MLGGRTRDLIVRLALVPIELQAPHDVLIEVEDHLVDLAGYVRARIDSFRMALASLPVRRFPRRDYEHELERARALTSLRDPGDASVVALALCRRIPVWSNDKDLRVVKEIQLFTTRDLFAMFP